MLKELKLFKLFRIKRCSILGKQNKMYANNFDRIQSSSLNICCNLEWSLMSLKLKLKSWFHYISKHTWKVVNQAVKTNELYQTMRCYFNFANFSTPKCIIIHFTGGLAYHGTFISNVAKGISISLEINRELWKHLSGWNLWLLFESSCWTFCAGEIYCPRNASSGSVQH